MQTSEDVRHATPTKAQQPHQSHAMHNCFFLNLALDFDWKSPLLSFGTSSEQTTAPRWCFPPSTSVLSSLQQFRFSVYNVVPNAAQCSSARCRSNCAIVFQKISKLTLFSLWHSLTLGIEESDLQHTGKDDQLFAPREQGTSWVRWRNCGALSGCVNYFRCAATIIRRRKKIESRPLMLCPKKLIQWARGILLTLDCTLMISWWRTFCQQNLRQDVEQGWGGKETNSLHWNTSVVCNDCRNHYPEVTNAFNLPTQDTDCNLHKCVYARLLYRKLIQDLNQLGSRQRKSLRHLGASFHQYISFNTKHANVARVHEPCIQVDVYAQKQIPTWQIDSAKTAQSHFLQASMAGTGKIPI